MRKECKMKRATQLVIAVLVFGTFINNSFAQQAMTDLQGLWKSNAGNVVKIDGNQGVLVETTVKTWEKYINKPIIKNITQHHDKWKVKELVSPEGRFVWLDITWELKKNRITKDLIYLTSEEENYYERIGFELSEEEKKADSTPDLAKNNTFPVQKHSWDVGLHTSYIKYEEPGVMDEKGYMYGIGGSYTYHDTYMFKAEGRYMFGEVDYTGSGTMDGVDDYIVEIRGLLGYDFITKTIVYTPYIGYGYRYLNDDLRGITSTGAKGYERESNYYYSPIGIETLTDLQNGWFIGVVLEYDYFWYGQQESHLSDADPGYSDLSNDQNSGYGYRCSIKFHKKGSGVDYVIEPYYIYWDIDKSEVSNITYSGILYGYGWEPDNESKEYGIKFTVKF